MKSLTLVQGNKQLDLLNTYASQLSENTRKSYEADLKGFESWTGKALYEATTKDIITYIRHLEQTSKNQTINRKIAGLKKVYKMYVMAGIKKNNIILQMTEVTKLTRPVLREPRRADIDKKKLDLIFQKKNRTSTIIKFLCNTGLRISELIHIQEKDVDDFNGNYKKIFIKGKNKKERNIFITRELYREIKNIFAEPSTYFFHTKAGNLLNRQTVCYQVRNMFYAATGSFISPHLLRHFYATQKITKEKKDVKAVSKYLGHSTSGITLDFYVDNTLDPADCMLE